MLPTNRILLSSFEQKNKNTLEEAKNNAKRNFAYIVGAGVSKSLGLPDWTQLLAQTISCILYIFDNDKGQKKMYHEIEKLREKALSYDAGNKFRDNYELCQKMIERGNLLETAEYIINYMRTGVPMALPEIKEGMANFRLVSLLYECLYKKWSEIYGKMEDQSIAAKDSTMAALVDCIVSNYNQHLGDDCTQTILTYNYDDLLECYLEKVAEIGQDKVKSFSYTDKADERQFESNRINIAHVHGKIDFLDDTKISPGIILTESSYYHIEKSGYLWQHTVQAQTLIDHPCLIVGFSAQDYNFRRIMKDIDPMEDTYIIFALDDMVNNLIDALVEKDKIKDKTRLMNQVFDDNNQEYAYERLLLAYLIKSQTQYWERNHIKPIWTTIGEMPRLIRKIGGV